MAEEKKEPQPEIREEAPPPEIGLTPEVQSAIQSVNIIDYLTKKLKEGEISIPEAIILADYLERRRAPPSKEEYEKPKSEKLSWQELMMIDSWLERKYSKTQAQSTPTLTPEQIENIVRRVLAENKPKTEEMPEWAKSIQAEMQAIRKRLQEEEQKERDKRLIEEHQRPILEKLKEAEARYVQLEKTLEELKKMPLTPQETASINTTLKQIKETLTDIRETGKLLGLKEPEESKSSNYGGIPVKGEVPVWAVAIPKIINEIFESIEKRAAMWLKPSQEPILKIPTPQEFAQPRLIEIQPSQPLIRIPPPPEAIPEQPVEAKPVEAKPIEAPVEIKKVEVKIEPPKPKEYKCKYCSQTFNKPIQLASHVRIVHKKEREEEKRKKQEAEQPQTPK